MRYTLLAIIALVFLLASFSSPLGFTVNGKITDNKGNPLQGVVVNEKGTQNSTTTTATGEFSFTVNSKEAILVVSSVGYDTKEIKLKGRSTLGIQLKLATSELQEVVVTAYGIQHEEEITSAASRIDAHTLSTSSNLSAPVLQGRVSGISIYKKGNARYSNKPKWFSNEPHNTEDYDAIVENRFLTTGENPLSTFSIDVDAASYSNMRRFLQNNQMPPPGSVRSEELINYFHYNYPQPVGQDPFSITTEMAECPWNKKHQLALIGLQGKNVAVDNLPPSNLVFLIDVSGSMQQENKLPLVKSSLKMLVNQLRPQDKVSLVVYAGAAGVVLQPTSGSNKNTINVAIDNLEAGGSTAGGEGIMLAYNTARKHFLKEGNNRIILCTDGDFNVGVSSDAALEKMVEQERKTGVFLTVLGYGMGNYKDNKMQKLADKGNGNHAYIDGILEAKKVLVTEFGGTLFTIAKDVKLQIEFNPAKVQAYRLIGYENRLLNKEDFNNDKKDAGELGSGHNVSALYEIIPVGVHNAFEEKTDILKYQQPLVLNQASATNEWMTIKFRYKQPDGEESKLIQHTVSNNGQQMKNTSDNFRFAAAVAQFGMLLNNSSFKQNASYNKVWQLAKTALGADKEGYRSEFLKLVRTAQNLNSTELEEGEEVSSNQ